MQKQLIESQSEFEALCRQLTQNDRVAMDTEFLRVRTYYPKLCLLQIACGREITCVDPLRVDLGVDPFRHFLSSRQTMKVFHSARQDIEVLRQYCGLIPQGIFDTQIAAAMLGMGDQIGYAGLVESVTGMKLDKAHTRTDWCQRPLSAEQVEYARDDVRYLDALYQFLREELVKHDRLPWVLEECETLSHAALYDDEPDLAHKRMRCGQKLDPLGQGILKELATWRERTSQSKDLPRNWVIKDATMMEIARNKPKNLSNLAAVEGVSEALVRRDGITILKLVQSVAGKKHHPVIWTEGDALQPEQKALRKRIVDYLAKVSKETGISLSLLGTRQDVEQLIRGDRDVSLLHGWRNRLLAEGLTALFPHISQAGDDAEISHCRPKNETRAG